MSYKFEDLVSKHHKAIIGMRGNLNLLEKLNFSTQDGLMNQKVEMKPDRAVISQFMNFYALELEAIFCHASYPEDDSLTPADARIDAIYKKDEKYIHIEHTSIDLIVSEKRNKRSLDPAILLIEEALAKSSIPSHWGIYLYFPIESARNIKRVKDGLQELVENVGFYIQNLDPEEWEKYPRKPDSISANGVVFGIKPDVLKSGKIRLGWLGSDDNFLEPDQLEKAVEGQMAAKLEKLVKSIKNGVTSSIGLLLIETNDVAARSFHDFAGVFAVIINRQQAKCNEVWGIHGNSSPTLIWCAPFDVGITGCVYYEDPKDRTRHQIESHRMFEWRKLRKAWLCEGT